MSLSNFTDEYGNYIDLKIGNNTTTLSDDLKLANNDIQNVNSIIFGNDITMTSNINSNVSIGYPGRINQGNKAVSIGSGAGKSGQKAEAVAIGSDSADTNQGSKAIAIGSDAGRLNQGTKAITIGNNSGEYKQSTNCVAIGDCAGFSNQNTRVIALSIELDIHHNQQVRLF